MIQTDRIVNVQRECRKSSYVWCIEVSSRSQLLLLLMSKRAGFQRRRELVGQHEAPGAGMHSVSGAVGAGAPVSGAGGVGLGVGCAVGPP